MANKVLNNSLVFRLIKKKNSLVFSLKDGTTVQRCALMRTVDNAREWNIGENLVGWNINKTHTNKSLLPHVRSNHSLYFFFDKNHSLYFICIFLDFFIPYFRLTACSLYCRQCFVLFWFKGHVVNSYSMATWRL